MGTANYIAAFMTGQSVRGCAGLSTIQREFQRQSVVPVGQWLPWNFPYRETDPFPERVPIVSASINNIICYATARLPAFRQRYSEAVARQFAPYDTVIVVAGSCGVELLNNLSLPAEILRRIHVFAFGPVSRKPPVGASAVVVQGRWDLISRAFHRHADHRYPCAHMEYLAVPETRRLFDEFCERVLSTERRAG
jgi:hypothetical protein